MRDMKLIRPFTICYISILSISNQFARAQVVKDTALTEQVSILSRQIAEMKEGDSHFMVAGLTTFGFVNQKTTTQLGGLRSSSRYNSLGDVNRYELSPMFLWRHGDKLLVEFEPSFNGISLGVNWAAISYFVSPYLIVRGGYIVLPFGSYSKHFAAGWINKLASDPIGVNPAGSDFGVEIGGGLPLGSMKATYDFAISNGFQLNADGTIQGVGINALINNKTLSGRLSILPFSNSSLEIGISGLYGSLAYPGVNFTPNKPVISMIAVDGNFVKNIDPVQLNFKCQYSLSKVNRQNYRNPIDSTTTYSFLNNTNASFAQLSVRPFLVENKFLKNLELAFRYVNYKTPVNSTFGQNYNERDYGVDYWLSWRTVLKITYENINATGSSNVAITGLQGSTGINRMVLQFSTEF